MEIIKNFIPLYSDDNSPAGRVSASIYPDSNHTFWNIKSTVVQRRSFQKENKFGLRKIVSLKFLIYRN